MLSYEEPDSVFLCYKSNLQFLGYLDLLKFTKYFFVTLQALLVGLYARSQKLLQRLAADIYLGISVLSNRDFYLYNFLDVIYLYLSGFEVIPYQVLIEVRKGGSGILYPGNSFAYQALHLKDYGIG